MTNKKEGLLNEERFKGPVWNILALVFLVLMVIGYVNGVGKNKNNEKDLVVNSSLPEVSTREVLPEDGVVLPAPWGQ